MFHFSSSWHKMTPSKHGFLSWYEMSPFFSLSFTIFPKGKGKGKIATLTQKGLAEGTKKNKKSMLLSRKAFF